MNRVPTKHRPHAASCAFAWCTTEHGETVHPDDEAHRSAGTGFVARVRDGRLGGLGVSTDLEVGIVRRADDEEAWVALEFGGYAVELDVVAARALARLLLEHSETAAALDAADGCDG